VSYKTILVHMADVRRASRLLDIAVPLARQMEAHLIGLSILPPYMVVPAMDMGGGAAITVDEHRKSYRDEMNQLRDAFLTATRGQPVDTERRAEWRESDADFITAPGAMLDHVRAVDLFICSQRDPDWRYSDMLEDPERMTMDCGRPVLVVPNAGKAAMPAKTVTIAWNGRRESARAVFDAMPLLKAAEDVNIIWVNPEDERKGAGDVPAAELCATLARHHVKCQASQASSLGGEVGSELLRQAEAFGSDLLVMGCYGHSRLREFILGGASRDILKNMRLPVLMSH
jgi:nucleotide-binding universal stress UspA family protein